MSRVRLLPEIAHYSLKMTVLGELHLYCVLESRGIIFHVMTSLPKLCSDLHLSLPHPPPPPPPLHRVAVYSTDGSRISTSTGVDLLLQSNFDLEVSDVKYRVEVSSDFKSVCS